MQQKKNSFSGSIGFVLAAAVSEIFGAFLIFVPRMVEDYF
jgi:hypothetical protein